MPVLGVIVKGAWALLVVRVAGARATLTLATMARYLLLGAMLGGVAVPVALRLGNPYNDTRPLWAELAALAVTGVLLVPVVSFLARARIRTGTSVSDAFLVGFLVGFGADLPGALLAASANKAAIPGLEAWPPFTLDVPDGPAFAGHGYWVGLVALAAAAAWRFGRRWWLAAAVGAVAWIIVSTEEAATVASGAAEWFTRFRDASPATAWVTLVGALVAAAAETVWARRGEPAAERSETARAWQTRLRERRLRTQLAIATAESRADRAGVHTAERVREELARSHTPSSARERLPTARDEWIRAVLTYALAPVLLAIAVLFLTHPAEGAGRRIWELSPIEWTPGAFTVTALCVALAAIVVWRLRYMGADRADPLPDELADGRARTMTLQACLGAALLALAYRAVELSPPWPSGLGYLTSLAPPTFTRQQWATLLLLAAVAATGAVLPDARQLPLEERRPLVMRNALTIGAAFAIVALATSLYGGMLADFHANHGPWLYDHFGRTGNTAAALLIATAVGAFAAVLAFAFQRAERRALDFFFDEEPT